MTISRLVAVDFNEVRSDPFVWDGAQIYTTIDEEAGFRERVVMYEPGEQTLRCDGEVFCIEDRGRGTFVRIRAIGDFYHVSVGGDDHAE